MDPYSSKSIDNLMRHCEGAYSPRTLRGYGNDLQIFSTWCASTNESWLPAKPDTVASFVVDQMENHRIATIKRRLSAIKFAHRVSNQDCPIGHNSVQLAVRRASRAKHRRPAQKLGLTADILKRIVEASPDTLSGLRDAALISVGYDTLCRSSELAAMRIEHLCINEAGATSVLISRSKGDIVGEGRIAYLSPQTIKPLARWIDSAEIAEGSIFRGLHTGRVSSRPLDTSSIRRLVKAASRRANLGREIVRQLSGHSMRVGAAQDMMTAGFDALAIMQAGGWKTPAVVLRYVENASTQALHEQRWKMLSGQH